MSQPGPGLLAGLSARFGQSYRTGEVIFREGEPGDALYIVLSGNVELSALGQDRQRRVLRRAGPGQVLGETSCFGGLPHGATASAAEASTLLRFPRAAVGELVRGSPDLAERIILELGERLRSTTSELLQAQTALDERTREVEVLRRRSKRPLEPWEIDQKL